MIVSIVTPNVVLGGGGGGGAIELDWSRGRVFDQGVADMFMTLMTEADNDLLCVDIKTSETRRTRPQPLNTVEMLKLASKQLGIGPQAAMRAAEHLYLSGYLSYPRTESTSYPSSFDFRDAIAIQRGHYQWGGYAKKLLAENSFVQVQYSLPSLIHPSHILPYYPLYTSLPYPPPILSLIRHFSPFTNHRSPMI